MTLDDRIYNFIARRVAMNATPSDRAIQLQFGLKNTDEALAAIGRLSRAGRITVEQVGHKRVIWCGGDVVDVEGVKPPEPLADDVVSVKRPAPSKPKVGKPKGDVDSGFIMEVERYLADTDIAPNAFGIAAMNDRQFVGRRLHRPMYADTRQRVRRYMAANPPEVASQDVHDVIGEPLPTQTPVATVKAPQPLYPPMSASRADMRYEFALAMIAELEVNQSCKMKPRISAKVLAAQIRSGIPFDAFVTSLIDIGLACWLEDEGQ